MLERKWPRRQRARSSEAVRPVWSSGCYWPARAWTSRCWRSMATSSAISAVTRCIAAPCGFSTSWGLWDRFSKLPYSEVRKAAFESNGRSVTYVDFERLRQPHPFIAMVPQWDLLNLLADAAITEPTLHVADEHRGDRLAAGRRQGHRGALPGIRRPRRTACRAHRRLRRPVVDRTARGRPADARLPGEVRRLVVSAAARRRYGILLPAPYRSGQGSGCDPTPRLFPNRLPRASRAPTRALRAQGIEAFRHEVAALVPEAAAFGGRAGIHGRCQAPGRQVESVATLALRWVAVHWRRGTRHVPDGRCRHQSGGSGCRRSRDDIGRTATAAPGHRPRPGGGPSPPRISHRGNAIRADECCTGACSVRCCAVRTPPRRQRCFG